MAKNREQLTHRSGRNWRGSMVQPRHRASSTFQFESHTMKLRLFSLCALLLAVGCSGDESITDPLAPQGLQLALSPATDTIYISDTLTGAETVKLTVTASTPLVGSIETPPGRLFASANPSVATVDSTGLVHARSVGTADITVRVNSIKAHTTITVLPVVHTVTVSAPVAEWLVGDTIPLTATALDWRGAIVPGRRFTYGSSASIATVTPSGIVTFATPGAATLTATTMGISGSLNLTVYAREYIGGALGSMASGNDATCGLLPLGRVYCFGRGPLLGVAKDTSCFDNTGPTQPCTLVPLRIAANQPMVSVSVGDSVACGITTESHAYCWGYQTYGQVGNGISNPSTAIEPQLVRGPLNQAATFTQVAAGGTHACGLDPSGTVYCWGNDAQFRLGGGDGILLNSSTPIPIRSTRQFKAIAAGQAHTCALQTADGAAYCWGSDSSGQLGYGTVGDSSDVPTRVPGPTYVQVTAGGAHTCGLTPDGLIYCWGANESGQSGQPSSSPITVPTRVAGSGYVAVAAGGKHTCAITSSGTAYCWGANVYGQLGRGTYGAGAWSDTPAAVQGSHSFSAISAGRRTTCAVASDGAYCWGSSVMGATGTQVQAIAVPAPTKTAIPE